MQRRSLKFLAAVLAVGVLPLPARAGDTVVHIILKGPLAEAPPSLDIGLAIGGGDKPQSMFDLLKKLNRIRSDDEVRGVLFELDEAALGFAQIQELRAQFEKLRAADKDVWVFAETLTPGQYLLASAATKIVMMPRGELVLMGIYAEASYFKNMLDKIGVEADIIHCGDYKSAGEPFYRTGPSKPAQEQEDRLLDSLYAQLVSLIADSRKIAADEVKASIDKAFMSPADAKKAKLVDETMYREDLNAALKRKYGDDMKLTRSYGKEKGPELDMNNPLSIFNFFSEVMKGPKKSHKPSIAIVYVDSMIVSGSSEDGFTGNTSGSTTIRRAIEKAAQDDSVKALVLRVDSPGGSAIASDVIAEAVKRCKKEKPVVVSMGDVAASGGYYVSCLADQIFAEPGTITGSIGVVGGKMVTKGLWDWVGVTGHEYKRGEHADLFNTNRKFSNDERKIVSDMMNRVYGEFKDRVTDGRGKKIKGDLEKLAGGRVFSGADAIKIGLVDQLGGLADAVRYAAEKAEVSKYEMRVLPEPKTIFDLLFKGLLDKDDEDDVSTRVHYGASLMQSPLLQGAMPMIEKSDPHKAAAIRRALMQLELMGRENVLLLEPGLPVIR